MNDWLIYGANGYTGRLIAQEAVRRGLQPVLAGRSAQAVAALGAELGLPTRVFDLADAAAVDAGLAGMKVVLHCAGPFSSTLAPMLAGCMRARAHYLDITGEVSVFEALFARHDALVAAGITAVSGTGFDVVPTDCLAGLLHRELPDATVLRLAIMAAGNISAGTAKSMIEGMGSPGLVREEGRLKTVPTGHQTRLIPFDASRSSLAVSISLGDLVTAFHTTGIPQIETFAQADLSTIAVLRLVGLLSPLLALSPVQQGLKQLASRWVQGPDAHHREVTRSSAWGEVENTAGEKRALRLQMPEAYAFTVLAALAAVEVLQAGQAPLGAQTPCKALGADFVLALPGVTLEKL